MPKGDTLNVRAEPSPHAKKVGEIPRDATGVVGLGPVQTKGGAVWRKVRFGSLAGWVNDAYLKPDSGQPTGTIRCFDIDPLWSVAFGPRGRFAVRGLGPGLRLDVRAQSFRSAP
ncbi:MAG TPA: hypothetical protein VFJ79_02530, partial [Acidimicrobiales bacterium]|nr:hypothetical protein [Acidimicrobiales bacterium]